MATSDPAPERLQAPVPCDVCKTGAPGKHYCTVCRKTLCNNCEEFHARLMNDHKVVSRAEMPSVDHSACRDHTDQTVTHYCEKCKRPICIECVTDQHYGHKITKLSTIVEKAKDKLQAKISETEQNQLTNIAKTLRDLQHAEDAYNKDATNTTKAMDEEAEKIMTELDQIKTEVNKVHLERKQKLKHTIDNDLAKLNDRRKDLENTENNVKRKTEEWKRKIDKCHDNPVDFLQFMESQIEMPDIDRKDPQLTLPRIHQPKNLNISEILKRLSLKYIPSQTSSPLEVVAPQIVSTFKAEVKGIPSICITNDGNAWIGGYESRELILVNINGKILNRRTTKHRTNNLVMMASGDIIISPHKDDSMSAIRLGTDGIERDILNVAPSWCNGVSVTSDQEILVCANMGRLLRCRSDGSNLREIFKKGKSGSAIYCVELPDKTIAISDQSIKGLVVIDEDGQQITTITRPLGGKNYRPWGLACDRMGNILSADYNNNCVYIIDQNRQVKELVGSSHGIKELKWVDIDKDDNLWIAQFDGTITVVKYLQ